MPAIPAQAQTVTVNGSTCNYSAYTFTPGGNFTFTTTGSCAGGATNAAMSVSVTGSLSADAGVSSTATITATCSGSCTGVTLVPSVSSPGSGVTVDPAAITNGTGTVTVRGLGPIAATQAVINLAASGQATGVTVTGVPASVNVPIVNTTAAGSTYFSTTNATSVTESGAAVLLNVLRMASGQNAAGISATVVCTPSASYAPSISIGGVAGNTGTLVWAGADATPKQISITPVVLPTGATTGSVTCTLTGTQVPTNTASTPTTWTLTIGKSAPVGGTTCTADKCYDLVQSGGFRVVPVLSGTQVASIKFEGSRYGAKGGGQIFISMPAPPFPQPNGTYFTISEQSNDVSFHSRCTVFDANSAYLTLNVTTTGEFGKCPLDPAKTYYLNMRFVDGNGASTCNGTCAVYTDWPLP